MWQYFLFVPLDRPLRLPGAEHPHRLCEDMVFECVSDGGFRSAGICVLKRGHRQYCDFTARPSVSGSAAIASMVYSQRGHPCLETRPSRSAANKRDFRFGVLLQTCAQRRVTLETSVVVRLALKEGRFCFLFSNMCVFPSGLQCPLSAHSVATAKIAVVSVARMK